MSRFKVFCGMVILLALVLVGIAGLTGESATAAAIKPPAPPPGHQAYQASQSYVPGNPAIKPSTSQNALPNTSGPAFTQADVIAFFQQYGFFAGPVVQGAQLQILTIQFVPAKQASQMMHGESVGRPDDYLVCYVKVKGPFLLTHIHGAPGSNANAPKTAESGDAVFDASTGNLLVWGIYFQK